MKENSSNEGLVLTQMILKIFDVQLTNTMLIKINALCPFLNI